MPSHQLKSLNSAVLSWIMLCFTSLSPAKELWVGSAQVDITPDRPVALAGNFTTRISPAPATPIIAVAASEGLSRELGINVGWNVNITLNSVDARISGVEFNARQPLRQLGGWGQFSLRTVLNSILCKK